MTYSITIPEELVKLDNKVIYDIKDKEQGDTFT